MGWSCALDRIKVTAPLKVVTPTRYSKISRERMDSVQLGRQHSRNKSFHVLCITTLSAVVALNLVIVHISLSSMGEMSSDIAFMEWQPIDTSRSRRRKNTRRSNMDSYWTDLHRDPKSSDKRIVIDSTVYDDLHKRVQQTPCNRRRICTLIHPLVDLSQTHSTKFVEDPMLHVTPGEEAPSQKGHEREDADIVQGECVPMKSWQIQNHPTCNSIHEIDMRLYGDTTNYAHSVVSFREDHTSILGKGWFRITWKAILGVAQEAVVLKTLRMDRDFFDEYYDLHRVDAVAMERLTSSPYVLNVYSFCGQSAVNEFADFIDGFQDFKTFARRIGGNRELKITKLKIQIATMLALGIMHIHEVDGPDNATMAHYDVNPMNVAVTAGGVPKFNDFNVAHFFKWNVRLNKRCGFYGRLHEPWWRSPEEMLQVNRTKMIQYEGTGGNFHLLDEKVDIYSLGNLIFLLLTGHSPRGQTDPTRIDEVRNFVQNGTPPFIDDFYENSSDPLIAAMIQALNSCYEPDPKHRGSAREIAGILMQALDEMNTAESSDIHQSTAPNNS